MSNFQGIRVVMRLVAASAISLLVAFGASAQTVRYIHTDGLGSVVLVTDKDRNTVERSEYEPYGSLLNRAVSDGPGYTGHIMDAATGFTYMQQRYYDPSIGSFLSTDPVTASANEDSHFNRYRYATNNPYKFTDPDGRQEEPIDEILEENEAYREMLRPTLVPVPPEQLNGPTVSFLPPSPLETIESDGIRAGQEMDKLINEISESNRRSEPPQLSRGKRAHKEEPILPGEFSEVETPSGGRMDRYNPTLRHIREIKPNNPRQIRLGERQVRRYKEEMEKETGEPHTTEVSPYDPEKYK
ncbi:hypothetical protein NB709_000443 [Xanthomonas sacchari]|nr:hypothetical protein [Xanthomonas sacchari]